MAALEIIALDTAIPRLRAPASGDTYEAKRAALFSASGSASAPTVAVGISNSGFYWDGNYMNVSVSGTRIAYFRSADCNIPRMTLQGRSVLASLTDGNFTLYNNSVNAFSLLQFGGTTTSFPALKRSSASLQARLADDSAFAAIQGKLTTDTAYAVGVVTGTGYLTLYDSNGTAYKVPAVAV